MTASLSRWPTYLRTVVTAKCPLSCSYCHMEGDPHQKGTAWGLDGDSLDQCLAVAVDAGIRKFKFLGGEPLARRDLPLRIANLRKKAPGADLSIITSGVADLGIVEQLFESGLDRMNMSIHGFSLSAFAQRSRLAETHFGRREAVLKFLLSVGRPLKLNYVYSQPSEQDDLGALLQWASEHGVLVNVLDDLGNDQLGARALVDVLRVLRGPWQKEYEEPDPDSLPTTRLAWSDGLTVEIKTSQLGLFSPWKDCQLCPQRNRCREGIYALRLTHQGRLQLCMDRPELGLPLLAVLGSGHQLALAAWMDFVSEHLRGPSVSPQALRQLRCLRLPIVGHGGTQ